MKSILLFIASLFILGCQANLKSLLKEDKLSSVNSSDISTFPITFYFNGTIALKGGVVGNAMFRFDGYNNIFSWAVGYYNSTLQRNVTETVAYDFGTNQTYRHTTENDSFCNNQSLPIKLGKNFNDFINEAWYKHAKIVSDKWEGGHHYQTIEVAYNSYYHFFIYSDNEQMYKINGTMFELPSSINVTYGITDQTFARIYHVTWPCVYV